MTLRIYVGIHQSHINFGKNLNFIKYKKNHLFNLIKEKIQKILNDKRQETMCKLHTNFNVLKNLENNILEIGLKTQAVQSENNKFIKVSIQFCKLIITF